MGEKKALTRPRLGAGVRGAGGALPWTLRDLGSWRCACAGSAAAGAAGRRFPWYRGSERRGCWASEGRFPGSGSRAPWVPLLRRGCAGRPARSTSSETMALVTGSLSILQLKRRPQRFLQTQAVGLQSLSDRLKAAVHYTVGCLCEEVASDKDMPFSKQTIAAISEVTFRQCAKIHHRGK
ncbi:centromere protein S isoform X3 [Phacochoerus africanus]|uniref:centromere protein S isoform X3 n=1 Tax=Phacochoerus africanus TaxID=41426 RepID=UPI001FDA8D54|nr:centromere protein S isoform X3 [Phacochoerus africanus]